MCLGVPMQIKAVENETALCERDGIQRQVALQLIDSENISPGDYVIVHLGFAIQRINLDDAKEAEVTWQEWSAFQSSAKGQGGGHA